nr:helix-turn-helix domain-containing protein [Deinococcus betulae]
MNLSSRQLERAFQTELGVSPKMLARAIRFDAVVEGLRLGSAGQLTTLAYDLGFTDQSHLTREFKTMSLMTPSAFVRQIERRWTGGDEED